MATCLRTRRLTHARTHTRKHAHTAGVQLVRHIPVIYVVYVEYKWCMLSIHSVHGVYGIRGIGPMLINVPDICLIYEVYVQ